MTMGLDNVLFFINYFLPSRTSGVATTKYFKGQEEQELKEEET